METFPKIGMTYEQVRTRLLKDDKYRMNKNLTTSILQQCQACEGDKAATELANEVYSKWTGRREGRSLSGAGNVQCGIGEGRSCSEDNTFKPLGCGRYRKTY